MAKMKDCSNRGRLMVMIGLLVTASLAILPFYPQDMGYAVCFLLPGLFSILAGGIVCVFGKREVYFSSDRLTAQRHSNNTVLFTWFWGIAVGAMPFYLSKQLRLVQALFESVSGWTTTGLSVMDVTNTSHIFLFYRSFMQYCGGLGFVMMMVMLVSGKRSMDLFNAEGHPDKLMPNLKQTAQTIFEMYLIFLIVGTAAYMVCGMPLFDSLCHAMCSLSTGGFSTKLNSIGEYRSLSVEIVTIVLMLIGTTNFGYANCNRRDRRTDHRNSGIHRKSNKSAALICRYFILQSVSKGIRIGFWWKFIKMRVSAPPLLKNVLVFRK